MLLSFQIFELDHSFVGFISCLYSVSLVINSNNFSYIVIFNSILMSIVLGLNAVKAVS
jgi:hypothetical protein